MGRLVDGKGRPLAVCVMGACGCGKSTIAQGIAEALGIQYLDADDFHPPSNVEKMRAGIALTDEDRVEWLASLHAAMSEKLSAGESLALACSALKQRYRDALEKGGLAVRWIYLKGDRETLLKRVGLRKDHYMPVSLVDSQLAALEEPEKAIVLDIRLPVQDLIEQSLVGLLALEECQGNEA